ncbi:hypothetical protein QAD02_017984 [Eretmocerus hayati]|uniref:Uncharacterized protein n=1 Tax=Eretmocerus hayati TaxID=131215 RepID=A0ACC2PFS5_9HYME|nr:hypothetical protein QAD02_017984 [Eretmocerus hayati]
MDSSSSSAGLLGRFYSSDNLSDDEDMGVPSDLFQDQQARVNAASASILGAFGRARRSTSAGAASDGSGSSLSGANSNGDHHDESLLVHPVNLAPEREGPDVTTHRRIGRWRRPAASTTLDDESPLLEVA